jgi:L-Lysine epsilon oxidase N-terminal/L-lysine epsilon oxidase C-terminal domain
MTHRIKDPGADNSKASVDCAADPVASLVEMFVGMVQGKRIAAGQCPALRPVFLKPHGVVHGVFRVNPELKEELRVGLFAGKEYPAWVRFSSDTAPTYNDYLSTIGVGIKLFDVPGEKIFGEPTDRTFDFILQNMNVFFVNTAKDMCEFTQAGVIGHNYDPYLEAHPETARLLDEMKKPVGSLLGSPYWSGLPFLFGKDALGKDRYVKYKLEPVLSVPPPATPPNDPTYLAADLATRLKAGEIKFRFCVQLCTNTDTMPLDMAMVPWSESDSPPVHVADLILHQQDITVRGQPEYGENLSWNIWRVTEEHRPQGSIADARRVVYAASAEARRNANGVPTGEPAHPKPASAPGPAVDSVIVRAAIHPAIGIARVGDSLTEFYVGPQVTEPAPRPPGFYRDATGALKREAAEFRIYGYNAAGDVVSELTADSADIVWTAHLANQKSQWYQFQMALDIPDAVGKSMPRRNPLVKPEERGCLAIDPGPRSVSGKSISGGDERLFNTGKFKETVVPLGEIRTDAAGRLLVLGGHGKSASPSGALIYDEKNPDSFNNPDDWYDDISDGPVTAAVSINGRSIPVQHAWVVVAPPNYGTNVIGWRTMYDLLTDSYIACGWLPMPRTTSFAKDILPFLRRLSNLQWVNKGFAAMFGKGAPMDFEDRAFVARLAKAPTPSERGTPADSWAALRQAIVNAFRPFESQSCQPRMWPWLYGDAYGSSTEDSPRNVLTLPSVQQVLLERWVAGDFIDDWNPGATQPQSIDDVKPVGDQPAMLDKAALHFCLADAFHPGCELTWPMRHTSMFESPFRIRLRPADEREPDYGKGLTPAIAMKPGGPLYDQGPGTLSRWMAIPWQGDTAFCRSGYPPHFDPYLPSFWPARVPNQVLTEDEYNVVMDTTQPREIRLAAFNNRAFWTRGLTGTAVEAMLKMVANFADMGVVEARKGLPFDPDFPAMIYVESIPPKRVEALRDQARLLKAAPATSAQRAGWEDEEQMASFTAIRVRFTR